MEPVRLIIAVVVLVLFGSEIVSDWDFKLLWMFAGGMLFAALLMESRAKGLAKKNDSDGTDIND